MNPLQSRSNKTRILILGSLAILVCLALLGAWFWWSGSRATYVQPLAFVSTIAGKKGEFGEPFGVATRGSDIFVSDGDKGVIWVLNSGEPRIFAEGLDTPSGLAFDN